MSWKSLVTVGLLCVLASPAFAVPTVDAVGGGTQASGHLDDDGNWVWQFRIAPTNPLPTGSTPLAAELGFTTSGSSDDITKNATKNATDWDTDNPGTQVPVFGWETLTDVDEGPGVNNRPVGVQTNMTTDEVFSALGSVVFTTTGPKDYVEITVERPATSDPLVLATTTIGVVGAYGGNGRIAELTTSDTESANYDTYNGSVTRQARAGDVNLDGNNTGGDFGVFQVGFNTAPGTWKWYNGDFNGDGNKTGGDFAMLQTNHNKPAYSVLVDGSIPGGGSGAVASATPEPASMALVALAGLGLAGLRFRRRS